MKSSQKAGPLKTLWLIIASAFFMADTCIRATILSFFGRITRDWADARIQIWTKQMLKLWRITCIVHNPKKVHPKPGQATIVMCNHGSLFDIPLTFHAFPKTSLRMLAKKELSKIPFMGPGMRAADFPIVDRKNRQKAIQNLKGLHHLLKSGIVMWIAPEGTRSATGKLGPFKKGGFITAIQTNAVIIPIGVRGATDIIPPRTHDFYLNRTAEVHIGEPIDASKFTLDNKDILIEEVRQSMLQLVGESS